MSKKNKSGKGFSSISKKTSLKKILPMNVNDCKIKEQQALTLINQGRPNQAESIYKELIAAGSGSHITHGNLGVLLKARGDLLGAIACYEAALKLNPNFIDAHYNLGNALRKCGDLETAIYSYKNVLKLNPSHVDAHYNLGNALREKGDLVEAINSYKNALKIKPSYAEVHNSLGNALQQQGNLHSAMKSYTKALEIDPENSNSFYFIGRIQAIQGDFKGCKNSFYKSTELNPSNTYALFELSRNINSDKEVDELVKQLGKVVTDRLNLEGKIMHEFSLANLQHKLKNYSIAALHLSKANKLKISCKPSDLSRRILQTQEATELARRIEEGSPSEGKGRIFIVGVPRCGSTLLEGILSIDTNICDLGESTALSQAMAQIQNSAKKTTSSLSIAYAEKINETLQNNLYTVDKNLYNFRFTEAIVRAMPAARIIHCRRHPLDTILSMLRSNLQIGNNYTSDPLDAAKFLIHQEEMMSRFKSIYGDHIFTFEYDAFTSEPKKQLLPLIDWLGLQWNEKYLHPEASKRFISTASIIQARQPIHNKSVGGWKNYRELLKPAERILKESGIFSL